MDIFPSILCPRGLPACINQPLTTPKTTGINQKPTNNRPIPRARDPKHLTLNHPPTMQAQRGQPYAIHRIRTPIAPLPAQIQGIRKVRTGNREPRRTRALILRVEGPSAAWDGEVPCRVVERCEDGHPRRQLVGVVADDEDTGLEVWVLGTRGGGVECMDVQVSLGGLGVVRPGGARTEVDAVAFVPLCDEDVC